MNIDINNNIDELEISEGLEAEEKIETPKKTLTEKLNQTILPSESVGFSK